MGRSERFLLRCVGFLGPLPVASVKKDTEREVFTTFVEEKNGIKYGAARAATLEALCDAC